ncbi:trypsin-like serine peptidase [Paraferrimonas sedimenticola]|uniref:Uncharacterized protein n=1 Tax=Paraferrimonas sedimenticola TaxID=375674 RepID=A0AA37RWM9_9GAMM|nr:hypothetical protein [Paraferrimonas sedimenticola]GLP96543.1 hypothetical protein GCM10007895_18490 [Paraferrimonas sedimenticola]
MQKLICGLFGVAVFFSTQVQAEAPLVQAVVDKQRVIKHWTKERRQQAIPRDLYLDKQGNGYIRGANGKMLAYGQAAESPRRGKPADDSQPPVISNPSPSNGAALSGASQNFSVQVTDNVGVQAVTIEFEAPAGSGSYTTFSANNTSGDTWSVSLNFNVSGDYNWRAIARDTAKKGGNSATSPWWGVNVDINGSGGGGNPGGGEGDLVTNSPWPDGGPIQTAAGRLFYEMPTSKNKRRWAGYVCSGTVIDDLLTGRTVIVTAAHCVYDDANKAFARNVLFIPNQAQTSGNGTDSNCDNDPLGCWVASFGVVESNWTSRTFPNNIPWDYAYYVVYDENHQGPGTSDIEAATGVFQLNFNAPQVGASGADSADVSYTRGMGYSYSDDPNFMYCAENMTEFDSANWWLGNCGLSGGSSGGPWIQPNVSALEVMSVNSWGYSDGSPGMAGPKLSGTTAQCLFDVAVATATTDTSDGNAGVVVSPSDCP